MKKDQIPVKEIVKQYLIKHGYDGLYSDLFECGCHVGHLMPCERFTNKDPYACFPGYKVEDPSDEYEFLIVAEKDTDRRTPDEWLKDPQLHGLRVIDPDGWDRKNYADDWAKPLTLSEMWEKVNISTVEIKEIPGDLLD